MKERKRYYLFGIILLFILGCVFFWIFHNGRSGAWRGQNLIQNGGFEKFSSDGKIVEWREESLLPGSAINITSATKHSGAFALKLEPDKANDLRFIQRIKVRGDTIYRFSAWVATENVSEGSAGANLSIMDSILRSQGVTGSKNWQLVELIFRTYTGQREVQLAVRLGHFGDLASGTAYFDDVKLERLPDSSDVAFQQIARPPDNQPVSAAGPGSAVQTWTIAIIGLFYFAFFAILGLSRRETDRLLLFGQRPFWERNATHILIALTFAGFLIRLLFIREAPFPTDLDCFKAWALRIAETGPSGFYKEGYFCDYPPFALVLLWPFGELIKLTGAASSAFWYPFLIKFPALLCDAGAAWMLYLLLRPKNPLLALGTAAAYLLLPPIIYLSAYWGQVDSYYLFLLLAAFYSLRKRHPEMAGILIALALAAKTQTVAFLPVLAFHLFQRYSWRRALVTIGLAFATFAFIFAPFVWNKPLGWVWEFYNRQAGQYPYASLNAANFLTLLGGNYTSDNLPIIGKLTFSHLGILFFAGSLTWSVWYYSRKRTMAALAAALTVSAFGFFLFFPRMHERYLLPFFALIWLTAGYMRDRRLYWLGGLLSLAFLFNLHAVITRYLNLLPENDFTRILYILGLVNLAGFVILLLLFHTHLSGAGKRLRCFFREYSAKVRNSLDSKLATRPFILNRRDYLRLAIILLLYAGLLFTRLGTTHTPQTGMDFPFGGDGVELILAAPIEVAAIGWYDAEGDGRLRLQGLRDDVWFDLGELNCDDYYVMKRLALAAGKLERVRAISSGAVGRVNEITLFDTADQVIPIKEVRDLRTGYIETPELHPLTDEAGWMAAKPSFLNSTYFDEVYHGRTAYEFVKKMPVYEVTHPPLGKDLLAIGIRLFGMNPFGMRVAHALMGLCFILALFFLGREVLVTRFGAYITMLLGFLDFMPLVQSRYSTIDTTSVLGITLMLIMAFKYLRCQEERPSRGLALGWLAGTILCFVLAISVKWTAAYGFAGVFACICLAKLRQYFVGRRVATPEKGRHSLGSFLGRNFLPSFGWGLLILAVAGAVIYYGSYAPFLTARGVPFWSGQGVQEVLKNQVDMYNYHHNLTATHPYSSWWWGWPFDFKPLWLYYDDKYVPPGYWATIVTLGNPLIWWAGMLAFLALCYRLAGWRRFSIIHYALILTASLYLPWVLVSRITYIYHFYPVLPLFLVLLAFMLEPFWRMKRGRVIVYVVLGGALALLVLFFPALTGIAAPKHYIEWLRWFPKDWMF
jgi:dolichyl-phosphate-mannose-protein mannosyltransferase